VHRFLEPMKDKRDRLHLDLLKSMQVGPSLKVIGFLFGPHLTWLSTYAS